MAEPMSEASTALRVAARLLSVKTIVVLFATIAIGLVVFSRTGSTADHARAVAAELHLKDSVAWSTPTRDAVEPSPRAKAEAAKIRTGRDHYAAGLRAIALGRTAEALAHLAKARRGDAERRARVLQARGDAMYFAGRRAEAVGAYRSALDLLPGDASIRNDLVAALLAADPRRATVEDFQASLLAAIDGLGRAHLDTALAMDALGDLHFMAGRFADAEVLFREALAIKEHALGGAHPSVAADMVRLADSAQMLGRWDEAERWATHAHAIYEVALGARHPFLAALDRRLAHLYARGGEPSAAGERLRGAAAIDPGSLTPGERATMTGAVQHAVVYGRKRHSGEIRATPPDPPREQLDARYVRPAPPTDVMRGHLNAAATAESEKRYYDAEKELQAALFWVESNRGVFHVETIPVLEAYRAYLIRRGRASDAQDLAYRIQVAQDKAREAERARVERLKSRYAPAGGRRPR
jgi:tetratricopeptide (TPR) repeat protein